MYPSTQFKLYLMNVFVENVFNMFQNNNKFVF